MNDPWVLIVDDDTALLQALPQALYLRLSGVKVDTSDSAPRALEQIQEHDYDAIVGDIKMPGMDGLELCKQLRRLPGYQKTPVIYVTSHSDFESRARSALSGGDDLIGKPVFALELAVKAMAHLLISQMDAKGT